jgi:4-hydroxy-tetrahydrodipicolinate synthase
MATDKTRLTTALGTPLDEDDNLDEAGLEAHLADQHDGGIDGILVAGTMGAMQLVRDETYAKLVERSVALWNGKGEVLVGAGDASLPRTLDRIAVLNEYPIDGVAVLAPYIFPFSQPELVDYYQALADASKAPVYLYDLPGLTRTKIEIPTMLELAGYPNIGGAKCSDSADWTRQLVDEAPDSFRIFIAQPDLLDMLIRHGLREHLDGIFGLAPRWSTTITRSAEAGDWSTAATSQHDLSVLRRLFGTYGGLPVMTAVLNARGIPGRYHPRPYRELTDERREALLAEPVVQKLLADEPA